MFYSFVRAIARGLVALINGNAHYENKDKLPDGPYILVGPHRTWYDPIYFALAGAPRKYSFMAKKELFKNPIVRYILVHANAFPVDRAKPGPSVIKIPVKTLKAGELSLIIFPSGTRHSDELKGGAAMIAKLSGVPIVPAVYQGPLTLKGLFARRKVTVRFGDPIYVDRKLKLDDVAMKDIESQMQNAFDTLDQEIDPDYKYVPTPKKKK